MRPVTNDEVWRAGQARYLCEATNRQAEASLVEKHRRIIERAGDNHRKEAEQSAARYV